MVSSERLLSDSRQARFNMISCQLRPNGIIDSLLIQAFETIPMEAFIPPIVQSLAYSDAALPLTQEITPKRWLLAPLLLAKLVQLARIQVTDKVLVIGCGVGYSLALLAPLAAQVVGVECDENLAKVAEAYGSERNFSNVHVKTGSLRAGYSKDAPYDAIIIEGAVSEIPDILTQQLTSEGRLVTVLKKQGQFGKGVLLTRNQDHLLQVEKFDGDCAYLPEFEPVRSFQL